MDVWIYFEQRKRECEDNSLLADGLTFSEEEGSDGRRGRILGHIVFTENIYLEVSESVQVVGNHIRRVDYAYFLVVDGVEYFGAERDPSHNPSVHGHGIGHKRLAAGPIAFKEVLAMGWHEVSFRTASD
jgi:hypothetical protein